MSVAFKTRIEGQDPYQVLLTRANVRQVLHDLSIDNGQLIVERPTEEDLVILEAAVTQLRGCWTTV